MSVQYTLLGFLAEESNYGYELKKKYDGYFGKDKPILTGQIYSTLARLKRDNKVKEIADTSESGGPDRVRYEITDRGKQDLQAWLEAPEAPSPQLQATMYIKAVLAILKDGDASPYLDNQRQAHIQRMRELTAQRRDSNLSDMLLIDHALYHLEADLRWIELTISRLTRLKEEILHEQTNN
ncbi:PadR family transcriptional regulator [TM7 phylum sp. oral taxon 346]|nr:PadR family transcriptional regulator [TM7 phylum sp. oral taxon 346]